VARALAEYMESSESAAEGEGEHEHSAGGNGFNMMQEIALRAGAEPEAGFTTPGQKIGDLCPECGQASVVNEEGCRKCYSCGFSEC
jgi:ribonucleoside-diphosphate reductase alpha chain